MNQMANNPDESARDAIDRLVEDVEAIPASDFANILDDPFEFFTREEDSRRSILVEVNTAISRSPLDTFTIYEKIKKELARIPTVDQATVADFTWETFQEFLEDGIPNRDSIYITAFERGLSIRLADL